MYKSYKFLTVSEITGLYIYQIIDDNFEDLVEIKNGTAICNAIIEVYSKRNLPVASNIIRFMLLCRNYYNWSLDDQIKHYKYYTPRWPEVDKEIKKYLLFS